MSDFDCRKAILLYVNHIEDRHVSMRKGNVV